MSCSEDDHMENFEELEFITGADESHPLHFKNIEANSDVRRPISSYVDLVAFIKSRHSRLPLVEINKPAKLILNDIMRTQANITHCDRSIIIEDEDKENKIFHYSNRNNLGAGICQGTCTLCKSYNVKKTKNRR